MRRETDHRSCSRTHTASPSKSCKSVKSTTQPPPKKFEVKKGRYTRHSLANPFLNFMRDYRKEVKNDNLAPRQIVSLGSKRWRGMSPAERAVYIKEAEEARKFGRRRKAKHTRRYGNLRKTYKVQKRDADICQECGYYLRKDDTSRDPSTCTTVTTRTSRSPSDSHEELSDDSEPYSDCESMSSMD